MQTLTRIFAFIGAVLGLLQLGLMFLSPMSAPQQAAGAGMALAYAVIPYCLWRVLS